MQRQISLLNGTQNMCWQLSRMGNKVERRLSTPLLMMWTWQVSLYRLLWSISTSIHHMCIMQMIMQGKKLHSGYLDDVLPINQARIP